MDGAHVLVVDDESTLSSLLARRLELRGFRVTQASSGQEALDILAGDGSFDAAVVDVMMPGMTGVDLLERIRAERAADSLPVLMLTARSDTALVVECLGRGANDFVSKPADVDILAARLRSHLERQRAQRALERSEERYALALRGSRDTIWDWDLVGDRLQVSDRWRSMLGRPPPSSGREARAGVHPDDLARLDAALSALWRGATETLDVDIRLVQGDEGWIWVQLRGAAVRSGARVRRIAGSIADLSRPRVHDEATGLPNRVLFVELVERARTRVGRDPQALLAVLAVRFERIPGLGEGDDWAQIVRAAASRIGGCVRSTDGLGTGGARSRGDGVACLGAQDFAIVLEGLGAESDAVRVGQRVVEAFQTPLEGGAIPVTLDPRVGLVIAPGATTRPAEELLAEAVHAIGRSDGAVGARVQVSDGAMQARAIARLRLESDLEIAIRSDGLALEFQPIVDLQHGRTIGAEALVRWTHPEHGRIPPDRFVPLAEHGRLIHPLGRWVAERALRQVGSWAGDGPMRLAINLSPRQLLEPGLGPTLQALVTDVGIPASRVELELTEGVFVSNPEAAGRALEALRSHGFRVALDDFGTGYSSLGYLRQFRVDTLKIDRSFVAGLPRDPGAVAIAQTILAMAHQFGLEVVAEGVETAEQARFLRDAGCEFAQGWHFSKSVPPADWGAARARADGLVSALGPRRE